MRITKYIHSCLLIEANGDRILVDPGTFTFRGGDVTPDTFGAVSAVFVTHDHADHVDDDAVKAILARNPAAVLFTNSEARAAFARRGLEAAIFEEGVKTIGRMPIRAVPAPHASMLGAVPPKNVAYVIGETLLVPGDSYASGMDSCRGVPVLALPIAAPWAKELETAAFAERIAPKVILPIHDGFVKEAFLAGRHQNFEKYFASRGIAFRSLVKPGDSAELA
ncbi:MAG TPA: MBL fold metallo-hydrolase [Thermoanaerobaculia bacterium]|jgi:L-ascorbate metabolism protein UlaG (beta-lactamase superfamily)